MNLFDFIYNEFISFCNEHNATDAINNAWIKRYGFDLGCKKFVLSNMSPNIINNTIHWSSSLCPPNRSWAELDGLWGERCYDIISPSCLDTTKYPDPITLYYIKDSSCIEYYSDELLCILLGNPLTTFRELNFSECGFDFPVSIDNVDVDNIKFITNYPSWMLKKIVIPSKNIVFKELSKNNIVTISERFLNAIKYFYGALACIYELGYESKVDYLDMDVNTGNVSYLPIDKTLKPDFDVSTAYTNSNRKVTTIGKLLNKFNCSEYLSKCDIERISTFFSGFKTKLNIEVWDSYRIKDAYLFKNYAPEMDCITSTLHKSCMRYEECQEYFKFYEMAEAKIAVALDKNRLICARALLWQIDKDTYYLDRIYSNSPFIVVQFANAVAKKYPIKYYRVDKKIYDISTHIELPKWPNYKIFRKNLINYNGPFPYVDTFSVFAPLTGELSTPIGIFNLHDTGGNYYTLQ